MKLSRESILQAALDIAEREGLEALTMRRLAEELDVWPMAIYRHYEDRNELLGAVADAALGRVHTPDGDGPWRGRIAEVLRGIRASLGEGSARLSGTRALLTPSGLRMSVSGVRILHEAGLDRPEAVQAWVALFAYATKFPPERVPDFVRRARLAIAELPDEDYASGAEMEGDLISAITSDESFTYGLERLLDGIEERLPAPRDG